MCPFAQIGVDTDGHVTGTSITLPSRQIADVQLFTCQDSPSVLGGVKLEQSLVEDVVDNGAVVLYKGVVEVGGAVEGHGLDVTSTWQEALQYAV